MSVCGTAWDDFFKGGIVELMETFRKRRIGSSTIVAAVFATTALLAACEEDQAPPVEYVRAIKTFTVIELASGQVRKFSGLVQATQTSALSFQIPGNVRKVAVKLGDRVKKGQVLAVLDKKPYQLDVQAATADLEKARANLQQKRAEYGRQKKLYAKKWIAKARLDRVLSAYESTKSQVNYAVAKLNLAKRDLANTTLRAPFSGSIAGKYIDPFVEVRAGKKLFDLDIAGTLEVAFDVPETVISRIAVGMPVSFKFVAKGAARGKGRLTEIGSAAGRANAFPVKASLVDPSPDIRSGMTTEVTLVFESESRTAGYMVPLAAIAPGKAEREGYVFVFDDKAGAVRKRPVKARGAQENMIAVEGVKPGDVIAIAGVNFLVDGQKVKLLNP